MIALKLDEVLRRLREELSSIPGARLILIFGSVARGSYRPDSDVDVMLVAENVSEARTMAREISSNIFADTGVPVTVIVVSPEDYSKREHLPDKKGERGGVPTLEGRGESIALMKKAESKSRSAKLLLIEGELEDAVSRAYYAAYNAARAILLLLGEEASTHRGVAFKLWTRPVELGLLDRKYARILSKLREA